MSGSPTPRSASGRRRPQRATCASTRSSRRLRRPAPRPCTRAMASWPSARRSPRRSTDAGLVFVGPPASVIEALGDKLGARRLARSVGVPTVPGTLDAMPLDRPDAMPGIVAEAERIGFPLLVKAAAGGGGRGMRRVERAAELPAALTAAAAEALAAFGDGTVYLEREIQDGAPRRGPAPWRRGGSRRRGRGAGLLDPAPASEARRGGPGAGSRGRGASAPPRGGGPGGNGGGAGQCGYRRVPAVCGWLDRLPRGQYAAPGRAWRDRARERPRPRAGAVPPRGRRAALRGRSGGGRPSR